MLNAHPPYHKISWGNPKPHVIWASYRGISHIEIHNETNIPWNFTLDTYPIVEFHISKFTMKLDVLWNFMRDMHCTVEFHISKFQMKLRYPGLSRLIRVILWNFVWENLEWHSVSCNFSCMRDHVIINALVNPQDLYVVRWYFPQMWKTK